jgi:hypothetical protein
VSALGWLLAVGAVWRVTLLAVADEITAPARDAVLRRFRGERLAYAASCPWCASVWLAVPIVGSGLAWSITGWLSAFASPD